MQTIEIYTPNRDANGTFVGLNHETVFYDPEALVEPIRIVRDFAKQSDFDRRRPVRIPGVLADDLSRSTVSRRPSRRAPDRVRSARHVRPALGADLGEILGRGHAEAEEEDIFSFE